MSVRSIVEGRSPNVTLGKILTDAGLAKGGLWREDLELGNAFARPLTVIAMGHVLQRLGIDCREEIAYQKQVLSIADEPPVIPAAPPALEQAERAIIAAVEKNIPQAAGTGVTFEQIMVSAGVLDKQGGYPDFLKPEAEAYESLPVAAMGHLLKRFNVDAQQEMEGSIDELSRYTEDSSVIEEMPRAIAAAAEKLLSRGRQR